MLGRLFPAAGKPNLHITASWITCNPHAGILQVFDQILRHAHCMWDGHCSENHKALPSKSTEDNTDVAVTYLPELDHMHMWNIASLYIHS